MPFAELKFMVRQMEKFSDDTEICRKYNNGEKLSPEEHERYLEIQHQVSEDRKCEDGDMG